MAYERAFSIDVPSRKPTTKDDGEPEVTLNGGS